MSAAERGLRLRLVTAARRMSALGLAHGKSGNVSARTGAGFLVTPSGMAYDAMGPGDIVAVDREGHVQGAGKPSSEWRIHRDVYAHHPDAGAVVHTHSFHATTLACLRRPIPAFHYEVAFAGGSDIRCSGYATFGTQELSDRALEALQGRKACLLANHGVVALGASLDEALGLAEKVEALARIYLAMPPGRGTCAPRRGRNDSRRRTPFHLRPITGDRPRFSAMRKIGSAPVS